MRKTLRTVLILCLYLGCAVLPAWAQEATTKSGNLAEVTVTGMGTDKDEAIRDAMRKAVEQGAGTFIYSQSETKDFALVRDTVLTRSAGFVQSHKVLSEKKTDDGVWEVKIQAVVSIKGIEDTWGVVKNLLQQMGRPKIMVFINEKVDGTVQEDSTVQTRIENLLLKSGFLLVERKQIQAIQKKDLEAAVTEDKPAKMQAIAKQFGAQLFISGSVTAAPGKTGEAYGVTMYRYTGDGNIKCYRSDTAQLLASQNATSYMPDKDSTRKAAARALESLGDKIAPKIQTDILGFWQEVLAGRGELVLEVDGLSFKQYTDLKKSLKEIKAVKDVTAEFNNNVAKCSIQSDVRAETLAERIVEAIPGLEITDVSQNVIKAKFKK